MPDAEPRLYVLCGPPCAGKTTLAEALTERLRMPFLEMDRWRMALFPAGRNSSEERTAAYSAMHHTAHWYLRNVPGKLLLVGSYQPPQQRRAVARLAAEFATPVLVVQLRVADGEAVSRFANRPASHPAQDLTAERARRLAGDYPYHAGAPVLDTTVRALKETIEAAAALMLDSRVAMGAAELAEWAAAAGPQRTVEAAGDTALGFG